MSEGHEHRRRHPLAAMAERHVAFLDVLRRWEGARADGLLPAPGLVATLRRHAGLDHLHALDIAYSGRGPARPSFHLAWSSGLDLPPEIADLVGDGLRQRRPALRDDLVAVAFTGTPSYHDVAVRWGAQLWRYERLILPAARDGRRVDQLIVCADRVAASFMH
jgi:hypothetical protein